MNETVTDVTTLSLLSGDTEKKIGKTTYIVTSRFNGDDTQTDMSSALLRLIKRELTALAGETPRIGE